MLIHAPIDPYLRRWMMFVDGENLAIRAQKVAQENGLPLVEGPNYMKDVFVWMPSFKPTGNGFQSARVPLQPHAIRAHYYTSVVGDEQRVASVRERLWELGFAPSVFKRDASQSKSKGVDITLARDMLGHAYRDNFDAAVLIAGDGDYVPLVEDVMRLGKAVYVGFFGGHGFGLNPLLKLACDQFFNLEDVFLNQWRTSQSSPK